MSLTWDDTPSATLPPAAATPARADATHTNLAARAHMAGGILEREYGQASGQASATNI